MAELNIADIDAIIFDFDGVMTDNRVLVMDNGTEAVFCNRADGQGINLLRDAGIRCFILSTEKNTVVTVRARKLGIRAVQGVSDKGAGLRALCAEENLDIRRVLFVGNDVNDIPAFAAAGISAAVADAQAEAKLAAHVVLASAGGAGVARELATLLVRPSGR